MRRALLCVALLVGCRKRPPPQAIVDAGPVAAVEIVDAGPKPPASLAMSVVGVFPSEISVALFPLADGIAVAQTSEHGWNVCTTAGSSSPADRTAKFKKTTRDTVRYVGGTADEIWITTTNNVGLHAKGTRAERIADRYIAVGELMPRLVVGLSTKADYPQFEFSPQSFVVLRGKGDTPNVPEMRFTELAFLGAGNLCGHGTSMKNEGADIYDAVWWNGDGRSHIAPVERPHLARAVARGPEGECLVIATPVDEMAPLAVARPSRDELTPFLTLPGSGGRFSVDRSGAIWFGGTDGLLHRVLPKLGEGSFDETKFALPSDVVAECKGKLAGPRVAEIAALDGDDVWLTVSCGNPSRMLLLHTEVDGSVRTWPAP